MLFFFRLGDFYEMFFQDAEIASKELEITLTSRDCGLSERAPMCGVPYHAAEGYIAKLIEKGYKVAVCEQIQDPAEAKGIVERDVVRIITPGTLLETSMLDERSNNYILAIFRDDNVFGLSWADISTGEFNISQISEEKALEKARDIISGITPREIITPRDDEVESKVFDMVNNPHDVTSTPYDIWAFQYDIAYQKLIDHFNVHSLEGFGCQHMNIGICAAGALLGYLNDTQKTLLKHITSIKPYQTQSSMVLDISTRRNLELTETIRGKSKKGSLLWLLDKSNTAMGGRL